MNAAFEKELQALIEKYRVHEALDVTAELAASLVVSQLGLLSKVPTGVWSCAPSS